MATAKTKTKPQDSSAPEKPGIRAEESANGAAQAAPVAPQPKTGKAPVSEAKVTPPSGETAPNPAAVKAVKANRLHIAARTNGFRRCGRGWPASGITVSADEFSPDEIERLRGEPELVVTVVEG